MASVFARVYEVVEMHPGVVFEGSSKRLPIHSAAQEGEGVAGSFATVESLEDTLMNEVDIQPADTITTRILEGLPDES